MDEPAVTLTDYALTALCAALVWRLRSGPHPGSAHRWLLLFFAAAGLAPLLGGTVHGFFGEAGTLGHDLLWTATLLVLGVVAVAATGLGGSLLLSPRSARRVQAVALVIFLAYAVFLLMEARGFVVAVALYLPAVLWLLVAVCVAARRTGRAGFRTAAGGLVLTLVAAAVQQAKLGFHPVYFDHNAVYHLLQAVALVMIYRGLRDALTAGHREAEPARPVA